MKQFCQDIYEELDTVYYMLSKKIRVIKVYPTEKAGILFSLCYRHVPEKTQEDYINLAFTREPKCVTSYRKVLHGMRETLLCYIGGDGEVLLSNVYKEDSTFKKEIVKWAHEKELPMEIILKL